MKIRKLSEKPWYTGAVVACIGVAFFVFLTNFRTVLSAVGGFLGNFKPIFLGIVFAYLFNPPAKFFYYKLFRRMKLGQTRWALSVALAFVAALLVLVLLLGAVVPQFVRSLAAFSESFDGYAQSLIRLIEGSPLKSVVDAGQLQTLSQNAMSSLSEFVRENAGRLLNSIADSGKGIISVVIALILSVYLLIDKKRVMAGVWRFARAIMPQHSVENLMDFSLRSDTILMSYLGQSLLDSLIVGGVNALFMLVCGMPYIGLVSVAVAVTNLIPNFGPVIGMVIGGFVLLLVNPFYALMFLAFSVVLQFVDGYILKPKLFSNSLGVSGLLILTASIVLGNMFGIWGMVLSIPAAAILSFVFRDYIVPRHEQRRNQSV